MRLALVGCFHRGSASVLLWRLCFVGVLLDVASKSIIGWCFHHFHHFPLRVPPLDGAGWLYVEPGCTVGVAIIYKGGRHVQCTMVCVLFATPSPPFHWVVLQMDGAVEQRSYEE